MKKAFLCVLAVLILLPAWVRAGGNSLSRVDGEISILPHPGATKTINVDNVARTLQGLYENGGGTWLAEDGTISPIGVIITCETNDTRWAFGGSTPTTALGHVFPADSSWILLGSGAIDSMMGISKEAADNTTCQSTPLY